MVHSRCSSWLWVLVAWLVLSCGDESSASAPAGSSSESAAPPIEGNSSVKAGQLTAGTWDDNRNYQFFEGYLAGQAADGKMALFTPAERQTALTTAGVRIDARQELDVAVVLDTTGSMGDEISYLQAEFLSISAALAAQFPGVVPRWALVVYRDHYDAFVTKTWDWTADPKTFHSALFTAQAQGGGDYPEATPEALQAASKLSWRPGSVAKVAFWVGDAPCHPGDEGQLASAVRSLRDQGVHVYPIAASGTNASAEHQMRSSAQVTGGRYLFLTDDSGIGDAHAEPTIPCYFVTAADKAILRMLRIELTGAYEEPNPADVLRTGGKPVAGICQLPNAATASAF